MTPVAPSELELVARVAIATVCGAAIGLEREFSDKPAGLRTHALVAMGAAAFTVAGFAAYGSLGTGVTIDPARIAAQVVNGIGFLGAGVVIFTGDRLRGLTTAAELWAVAAIGVLTGLGMWMVGAAATAMILIIIVGGRPLESMIDRMRLRRVRRAMAKERSTLASYELVDDEEVLPSASDAAVSGARQ
jgi:putative Mg2+ transporter-C (MgtC) family protein